MTCLPLLDVFARGKEEIDSHSFAPGSAPLATKWSQSSSAAREPKSAHARHYNTPALVLARDLNHVPVHSGAH